MDSDSGLLHSCAEHGDRKGRHYYTTRAARSPGIVVATLAVAMLCCTTALVDEYG